MADNLRVMEVAVAPGGDSDGGMRAQRFVVCHNPAQAERDAAVRANLVSHLEQLIDGSDAWSARRRDEFIGSLKGALALRPVFHHHVDRIRSHVQLCWLALLLIRVAENTTGQTWRTLRHQLDRLHLVTLATGSGTVAQRSMLTPGQKAVLTALDLPRAAPLLRLHPASA